MGGNQQVGDVPQGAVLRQRLGHRHVQSRSPQLALLHGPPQGVLVQGGTPSGVDKDGVVLHKSDARLVHQPRALGVVRQAEGHHVGLGQQLVQLLQGEHLIKALHRSAHRPLQADGVGAQSPAHACKSGADVSRAHHQHGAAVDGLHHTLVRPAVLLLAVPVGGQTAAQGHHAGQHMLGHAQAVAAAGGGHNDARRQDAFSLVLVRSRPHGLQPLKIPGIMQLLGLGPAENNGGLLQLLGGNCFASGVDMDGVRGQGLKLLPLPLGQRKQIQNILRHRDLLSRIKTLCPHYTG